MNAGLDWFLSLPLLPELVLFVFLAAPFAKISAKAGFRRAWGVLLALMLALPSFSRHIAGDLVPGGAESMYIVGVLAIALEATTTLGIYLLIWTFALSRWPALGAPRPQE